MFDPSFFSTLTLAVHHDRLADAAARQVHRRCFASQLGADGNEMTGPRAERTGATDGQAGRSVAPFTSRRLACAAPADRDEDPRRCRLGSSSSWTRSNRHSLRLGMWPDDQDSARCGYPTVLGGSGQGYSSTLS